MSGAFRRVSRIATGVLVSVASLSAFAAEGRIPIPFTSPPVTPIVITAPGRYILTRPIKATGPGDVIRVALPVAATGDVDIDLNGFTLDGTPNPGNPVITVAVAAGATGEIAIHDGATQGGLNGILVSGASSRKVVIDRVRTGSTAGDGLDIRDALNTSVRNCVIVDAGGVGVHLTSGALLSRQATIEGNLIRTTRGGIVAQNSITVAILNNRLDQIAGGGPFLDGILLDTCPGSLVSENTIRDVLGAGGNGIALRNTVGAKLFDNVVNRSAANGIAVDLTSSDNLILRSVVSQCGGSGLFVAGDRNQIESNLLNLNGRGLTLDLPATAVQNLYRGNTARGNTGAAACPAAVCSVDFCGFAAVNHTQGDNWMPAVAGAPPVCEK